PGRPSDARGLMLAAIRDDNPVLFFEPMALAHAPRELVDFGEAVRIGEARVARSGRHVSVVAIGSMVLASLRAADALATDGLDVEVIDLRSLQPLESKAEVEEGRVSGCLVPDYASEVTS